MHNKKINNNKSQKFFQGLRPFSSTIPHGLKKILKKSGYNFSHIVDNWTRMVGKDVSNSCYPSGIKIGKEVKEGSLILNVIHGNELEVEYNKKNIIDKINTFFGYNFISQIKLNIIHEKKTKKKEIDTENKIFNNFEVELKRIKNSELKRSLDQFVRAYNEKKY